MKKEGSFLVKFEGLDRLKDEITVTLEYDDKENFALVSSDIIDEAIFVILDTCNIKITKL